MATEQTSNLSPTALKVLPNLRKIMKALREKATKPRENYTDEMREEYGDLESVQERMEVQENMVALANKISRKEASSEEVVDFGLLLAEVKSNVLSDSTLNEEQRVISINFFRKLRASILGSTA